MPLIERSRILMTDADYKGNEQSGAIRLISAELLSTRRRLLCVLRSGTRPCCQDTDLETLFCIPISSWREKVGCWRLAGHHLFNAVDVDHTLPLGLLTILLVTFGNIITTAV